MTLIREGRAEDEKSPIMNISFTSTRKFAQPASVIFDELINWQGHAIWVPMTRVKIITGDGGAGTEFVATTGLGPISLTDRMRVDELDRQAMRVRITKIGPVLTGVVEMQVVATGRANAYITWREDIRVPIIPQFLGRPTAAVAQRAFLISLNRLAKMLPPSSI